MPGHTISPEKKDKHWLALLSKQISRFFVLLLRPFIDFYYNYGLSRASVMSYVLCANLIIFIYLFLALTIAIEPFASVSSVRRLLELHLLWPFPEKLYIEKAPTDFRLSVGDVVVVEEYEAAIQQYCAKHKKERKNVEEKDVKCNEFSITLKLGESIVDATQTFLDKRQNFPLGVNFFIILGIAYTALLLNIKTNLAESVSPFVWGNLPLANRSSDIGKILWRLPDENVLRSRMYLFFMLPLLTAVATALLFTFHKLVDYLITPYSPGNTIITGCISLVITTFLFASLYELHVSGISKRNAGIGAFVAAALWLGGRWLFTKYTAVSLYRTLQNFAFVPIALTWFYYFCAVFLFGIYVAYTLENPNLSSVARWWTMRDISIHNLYTFLSTWLRLDFLCRLVRSRNEESRPPFIGINVPGDAADDIARVCSLPPVFVRECILDMLTRHAQTFCIEVEGNRQYCKLRLPPEEVDVIPLLHDPQEVDKMLGEMEQYEFGQFIMAKFGPFWNVQALKLSEVYRAYKAFQEKQRIIAAEEKS